MSTNPQAERLPPDAKTVVKRALILREWLIKGMAPPPPDYLAAWMKQWNETDQIRFVEKMQGMYSKRIGIPRQSGLWDELDQNEQGSLNAGPTELSMQAVVDANWLGDDRLPVVVAGLGCRNPAL